VSAGSNMPSFAWLAQDRVDTHTTGKKLSLMQRLGVPYTNDDVDQAQTTLIAQGQGIVTELATAGIQTRPDAEMVALIAYLQRLGRGPQPPPAAPGTVHVAQNHAEGGK